MTESSLSEMSIGHLVEEFTRIGVAQNDAENRDDIPLGTRLYWEMDAVEEELKAREGDARSALLHLYQHPVMQVRLKAAKATLAVAPATARRALEEIRASKWYPQAMDAGMCLHALNDGIFKPT